MHDFVSLNNRIKKNLKLLKKWAQKNHIEAFRIYDRDIPQFPFSIDIYAQELYLQEYDTGWVMSESEYQIWLAGVKEAIVKAIDFEPKIINFRQRIRQKGKAQYEKYTDAVREYVVREGDGLFLVNLQQYIDTGLFLDHRSMRFYVAHHSLNKKILNLFCYTASFSVHAARGGAIYSESVDLSNTYLEWARRNFLLNQIDLSAHHLIRQDVFEYLSEAMQQEKKFDLIILDPPSFSNSKKMISVLDIQKDHELLIEQSMKLLEKPGLLIFSNNFRHFKMSPNILKRYNVSDKNKEYIPMDFRNKKIHQCWWISHY